MEFPSFRENDSVQLGYDVVTYYESYLSWTSHPTLYNARLQNTNAVQVLSTRWRRICETLIDLIKMSFESCQSFLNLGSLVHPLSEYIY